MSAQSQLSKAFVLALVSGVLATPVCKADDEADRRALYSRYRSHDDVQGLYELREAAVDWVNKLNAKKNTNWIVGGPSIQIVISRCAVPLKVAWAPDIVQHEGSKGVNVICKKTVKGASEKNWDVFVDVFRPSDVHAKR